MFSVVRSCLFSTSLALALGSFITANAQAATVTSLPPKVAKALAASKIPASSLSLVMLPLTGPGNTVLVNPDQSMNPASTMKLVTTYAALETLGPTYQWQTEFYGDGSLRDGVLHGNLYLKGGGDPKLNMEKLWLLLRDLRANGIKQITGDLVLDRSRFNVPQLPSFNDDGGDHNKPFLVGPDALMVNLKAVRVVTRADGGKASVAVEPPIEAIGIDNQLKVSKAGPCPSWPDVRLNPINENGRIRINITGSLPDGCNAQSYISLLDHPIYTAGAVRAIWKELGGSINGNDREGTPPKGAQLLVRSFSPDTVEIIRDINKYSNNTMARQVFLSIGAQFRDKADKDDAWAAQRVIRNWLARKGINASHLVMENGSGLSRNERISAREMAQLLQAAYHSPYSAEFISSLPLVGMDGTMRKRLKRTALQGQAHIKTGTLNTVRAIAGFARDRKGQTWVIVAFLNDNRPWGASSILDQALIELYNQP